MTGIVKVSAKCPHCDVRKHQIDFAEDPSRAKQIVGGAITRHIAVAHPGVSTPPVVEGGGDR